MRISPIIQSPVLWLGACALVAAWAIAWISDVDAPPVAKEPIYDAAVLGTPQLIARCVPAPTPQLFVADECLLLPAPHDAGEGADAEDAQCVRLPIPDEFVRPVVAEIGTQPDTRPEPLPALTPAANAPPIHNPLDPGPDERPPIDAQGRAWWNVGVTQSLREESKPWQVDLDSLLLLTLTRSDHVQAISLEPQIRETEINRQLAQFDTTGFLESKWNDLNDPVGNTLTTGGPSRYLDNDWQNRGGYRRKNWIGGQGEIAQEIGLRDTNSVYFLPANQANTRMVLSYTQPLMRGSGQCYNESVVVLAQIDVQIAQHELQGQLQDHFFTVAEAYWKLWLERARLMQRRDAAAKTAALLRELENRRDIDVLQSHILRARGALAVHEAAEKRAALSVRNQETRLWALTGVQQLHTKSPHELIPQALPELKIPLPDRDVSVQEAVQQRPEVTASIERIKASHTRTSVAAHELKPLLNLALQAYAHGLDGQFDIGNAFLNQFSRGGPGYTAGLVYEVPLGNAAAQARYRRRQLEARQLTLELEATLKSVAADVDNVLRDIEAAKATAQGQYQAMLAARAELDYVLGRWRMLPGEDRATSLMLDEALDALDRLVNAEGALAQAQVEYALTLIQYKRATGQLFQFQPMSGPSDETLIGRKRAEQAQGPRTTPARR